MRLHAVQAYMPVLLAGVTFTIPVNTKLITADANGDIHAWVCYPEEVECYHEFWCSETSDSIFLGRIDVWQSFHWTTPLWRVGELNPWSLQFQITHRGFTTTTVTGNIALTDNEIAKIRYLVDKLLDTPEYAIKTRVRSPDKLGVIQKAFKIQVDNVYYGECVNDGVLAYTTIIPFDEIEAVTSDLIIEASHE